MVRFSNICFVASAALVVVATSDTAKARKGGENQANSRCEREERTIADLQKDLEAATQGQCQPFSLVDPIINVYKAAGEVTSHMYEIGQQNEKVVAVTSKVYEHSKHTIAMVTDKVSSVDYAKHLQAVKDHDIFQKYVAPQFDAMSKAASGPLNEHVYPTLEKVKVNIVPTFQTAKEKTEIVYRRTREEALPRLQTVSSKAAEHLSKIPVEKAVSTVFNKLEAVAPNQANALPKKTADRVVLILLVLFILYKSICWGRKLFRVVTFFIRTAFKIVYFALRIVLFIPMRLALKMLRITMCICTGFYCCGLCRRRKQKVADLKDKASGKSKAGDDKKTADARKDSKESNNEVSVAEVCQYLEQRQKENRKLDEYVQQFALVAKGGKPLTQKGMKGKTISKDTLKKACAKFKEIDIKKFGL